MIPLGHNVPMDRIELAKPISREFMHTCSLCTHSKVLDQALKDPGVNKTKPLPLAVCTLLRGGRQQTDKYITCQVVMIPYLISPFPFAKLPVP